MHAGPLPRSTIVRCIVLTSRPLPLQVHVVDMKDAHPRLGKYLFTNNLNQVRWLCTLTYSTTAVVSNAPEVARRQYFCSGGTSCWTWSAGGCPCVYVTCVPSADR